MGTYNVVYDTHNIVFGGEAVVLQLLGGEFYYCLYLRNVVPRGD